MLMIAKGALSYLAQDERLAIIANYRDHFRTYICKNHAATPLATPDTRRMRATQWQVAQYHNPPLALST